MFDHKFTIAGTYAYRCDQHFGGGMFGAITVEDPTAGIETVTANNSGIVNIYPIPASQELTVELTNELINTSQELMLVVFDLNGKEVLSETKISSATIQLNTIQLENGMYIIKLLNGSEQLESQIISINR